MLNLEWNRLLRVSDFSAAFWLSPHISGVWNAYPHSRAPLSQPSTSKKRLHAGWGAQCEAQHGRPPQAPDGLFISDHRLPRVWLASRVALASFSQHDARNGFSLQDLACAWFGLACTWNAGLDAAPGMASQQG